MNGFKAKTTVSSEAEANEWLRRTAITLYPVSDFAKARPPSGAAAEDGMVATFGLIGLAGGVFLMLRYGLPDHMQLHRLNVVLKSLTDREAHETERRKAIGMIGLVIFTAGTILLAISLMRDGMF